MKLNIPKDRNKKISSEELTKFIESLSDDFSFGVNGQFDRVAIYWQGQLITSYPFGYLSADDVFSYEGNLRERGYMHVLGTIFKDALGDKIYLPYEKRRELIQTLEELHYFIDPRDNAGRQSEKAKDIEKTRERLASEYGVGVHEGILPQYEKEYINRTV